MKEKKTVPIYSLSVTDHPTSCLVKIGHNQIRSLIDTGAELSLLSERAYNSLKYRPPLKRKNIALQAANGSGIKVLGEIILPFKMGGVKLEHNFIVASDLNRSMLLGRDFLFKNGVRLYCDLKKIRVKGAYIPLENDIHISAVTRLSKTVTLKPRTVYLVEAKVKKTGYFDEKAAYQLENLESGFLATQPEIEISPALVTLSDDPLTGSPHQGKVKLNRFGAAKEKKRESYSFPVQITNDSDKHVRLKRGCLLGKIRKAAVIETIQRDKPCKKSDKEFVEEIHADKEHEGVVAEMLLRNKDLFAFSDLELEKTDLMTAEMDTGDARPINLRPYRIPLAQRETVSEALDEMVSAGLIRPSCSPWNFPMVLVQKKPEPGQPPPRPRMCIDFRALNRVLRIQSFPLPLIEDILGNLRGSTYYSTLDLRSGFHQIPLSEDSIPKTAFSCFKGKFEFTVLPFGVANAPSLFQAMATKLLSGCEEFAIAYIDGILIHTKSTIEDHLKHVQMVLDRIRRHNLRLKLSKCHFRLASGFVDKRQQWADTTNNLDNQTSILMLKEISSKIHI